MSEGSMTSGLQTYIRAYKYSAYSHLSDFIYAVPFDWNVLSSVSILQGHPSKKFALLDLNHVWDGQNDIPLLWDANAPYLNPSFSKERALP